MRSVVIDFGTDSTVVKDIGGRLSGIGSKRGGRDSVEISSKESALSTGFGDAIRGRFLYWTNVWCKYQLIEPQILALVILFELWFCSFYGCGSLFIASLCTNGAASTFTPAGGSVSGAGAF